MLPSIIGGLAEDREPEVDKTAAAMRGIRKPIEILKGRSRLYNKAKRRGPLAHWPSLFTALFPREPLKPPVLGRI